MKELKLIEEKLDLAGEGKSQVVAVVAEAGLGKSRLVAEVVRSARRKGFVGYGGACQSDAIHTPYQAWKSIWGAFFEVDHEMSLKKQMRFIEGEIEDRAPSRVDAMPLLNVILDLNIPENDFTQNLEPKIRQSALHALLEDCLKAATKDEPLLIVIEDLHWVDALSHDLLEQLAKTLANYAVCFVLAYRPPQMERLQAPRLEALAQFTKIELHELTITEAESAIRAKLAQLYPARGGALPSGLVETLMARAQGNPFYLEELLNYVRDRGLNPADIENIELPDSLHTLILSRIDQLSEAEKTTLRVASIVGRLFRAKWLTGYYPELGAFPTVKSSLDALESLDITPLDSPEPELAYLFKHIVTHEVTYESLPFATRARLHEQLAVYLENLGTVTAPLLETLAFHYGRSENTAKQMEYLRRAGEAAQKNFANDAALDYFAKLLPLMPNSNEKIELHLKRGDILELSGQWAEAEVDYQATLILAEQMHNARARVRCQLAFSNLAFDRGNYPDARQWAEQALIGADAIADLPLQTSSALWLCHTEWGLSNWISAQKYGEQALELARAQGDLKTVAEVLRRLTRVVFQLNNYDLSRTMIEESLSLARQIGNKSLLVHTLNDYGVIVRIQGKLDEAYAIHTEQQALAKEIGDKFYLAYALNNMANSAHMRGMLDEANHFNKQALALHRYLGAKRLIAETLLVFSKICFEQGDYPTAQHLAEETLTLYRETGAKVGIIYALDNLGLLALATNDLTNARAHFSEILSLCREMGDPSGIPYDNLMRAMIAVLQGQAIEAQRLGTEGLTAIRETSTSLGIASSLCNVGFIAYHQQEYVEAQAYYLETINIYWPIEYRGFDWAEAWAGLARAFMRQSAATARGVQLAAVAENILQDMGAVLWPIVRAQFDDALAFAKESLGAAGFQFAWEEGAKWTLEEAVKRALGEG